MNFPDVRTWVFTGAPELDINSREGLSTELEYVLLELDHIGLLNNYLVLLITSILLNWSLNRGKKNAVLVI